MATSLVAITRATEEPKWVRPRRNAYSSNTSDYTQISPPSNVARDNPKVAVRRQISSAFLAVCRSTNYRPPSPRNW